MKQNLITIQNEYLALINEIEEAEGLITEEQEAALTINESDFQQKAIAYKEVINAKKSFVARIDDEIKKYQQMKKTSVNVIDRCENMLLNAVILFGPIEVGLTKFGTRKSTSVEVTDVNALPKEYKTIKVVESADKIAIGKALKAGEIIEGCTLNEKLNLKIN